MAGDVKVSLVKDWINVSASYSSIDSLFNPQMGYVRRGGIRKSDGTLGFAKWINSRFLKSVSLQNTIIYTTSQADVLETREMGARAQITARSGDSFSFGMNRDYDFLPKEDAIRDIRIDPGRYTALYQNVSVSSNGSRQVAGSISYRWGEHLDGRSKRVSLANRTRITAHLNMDLSYTYNNLVLKNGSLSANVLAGRWTYSFTTEMFTKAYIQWNDADSRIAVNLLFDYIYSPKSHVYIVYNEIRDTGTVASRDIRDRLLQLKATYLWNL